MSRLTSFALMGNQPTVVDRPVLDEFAQEVAITASMEAFSDIQQMQQEVDTSADIAIGLENLATVVDQIESASNSELGLIDIAGDLAMAGTGVSGAFMTPGLESAKDDVVSTEGIKTMAQDLWKAIKDFTKRIAKRVSDFFHNIFGAMPRLRKSLVKLKERADSYADKSIEESKTELGEEANRVAINYNAPANGSGLIDNLKQSSSAINFIFDNYTAAVELRGKVIKDGLKAFKIEKDSTEGQLSAALNELFKFDAGKEKDVFQLSGLDGRSEVRNDPRFDADAKNYMVQLPGNMALFSDGQSSAIDGDNNTAVLSAARAHRSRMVRVMSCVPKAKDAVEDAEIATLSIAEIKAAADVCIDIIDGIEAWERGKAIDKVKAAKKDIQAAGEKVNSQMDKVNDLTSELRAYPKSALEFVRSYETWSSEPHTALTSNGVAAVRAAIVICNKSLSNYK